MAAFGSIFLSYRRSDSPNEAGRIYDHLELGFGKGYTFRDVDSIPIGVNFRKALEQAIERCKILLLVIGPGWLTASDSRGERRLQACDDWVRIEIECALKRGIAIIPILIGGTEMPERDELPGSIQELTDYQATKVRPDPDFRTDMRRLMDGISPLIGVVHPPTATKATVNNYFDRYGGRFKLRPDGKRLNELLASFTSQATEARQSEARTDVGSLNRGQQAFYIEHSGFAQNLDELELGITAETDNYC